MDLEEATGNDLVQAATFEIWIRNEPCDAG
jgi:hypothetical protein